MMMQAKHIFLIVALVGGRAVAPPQFWGKKDYRQWSRKECQKLLRDSPWSKRHILKQVFIEPTGAASTTRAREQAPEMTYQVQFHSALPIRQAEVRLQQLRIKYDQLSPEQQQAFDERAEAYLTKEFSETVMVHVSYGSNVTFDDRDLARYWQTQTTDRLKNRVYLIGAHGLKVPLLHYSVSEGAGRTFQMVFPRQHQGQPLVGPSDKSLKLEFPHPRIGSQRASRVLIEFKLKKMLIDGAVVY